MNRTLCATLIIATSIISSLHAAADDNMPLLVKTCVRFHHGDQDQSLLVHAPHVLLHAALVPSSLRRIEIDTTPDGARIREQIEQKQSSYLVLGRTNNGNLLSYSGADDAAEMPASAYGAKSRFFILFADQAPTQQIRMVSEFVKNADHRMELDGIFECLKTEHRCATKAFALFDVHAYLRNLAPDWREILPRVEITTADGRIEYLSKGDATVRERDRKDKQIAALAGGGLALIAVAGSVIAYKNGKCAIQ